ncbi:transcriptional regulator [Actinocorallia sp. A-T 12471]|uniref:helix-turn-helix transcriptional regulator n=1 Tax=Actinocorallia sp. A-T 12471 TaxID=3089813 RepID=UPI0029D33A21|nr:transcriptional regulator [Actinocorallia sp. A-T 12471]MDX6741417.1 transcriptional regulator [Actinocorallia sp. A-T 12471]
MDIEAIALLQDPVRRRLYEFVAGAGADVGRNEASSAAGVSRTLAAFHLDKLVEGGLLDAVFRRPEGRAGPGAGRPAKYYRRAETEFTASVPPRDYRGVASLLAETVAEAGLDDRAVEAAREAGRAGEREPLLDVLRARGYVPLERDEQVRLLNCPFHALAEEFPPLVCAMNLALLEGLAEGTSWRARMAPGAGRCCVALSKTNEV